VQKLSFLALVIFVGSQISSGILVRASISSVPLGFLPFATPGFIPAFWFSEAGGKFSAFSLWCYASANTVPHGFVQ
jgi:hypothetical protein